MASKVLCLVVILIVASGANESRLIGGTPTSIEKFPYIVAFLYFDPIFRNYEQRCLGSLVSSYHVLTTANCFTDADIIFMMVRAGSSSSLNEGVLSTIERFVKHYNYEENPLHADISVTFLNMPLSLSDTINILYLPRTNWYIPDRDLVKVISRGFDSDGAGEIQIEFLKLMTMSKCRATYKDDKNIVIDDSVICATLPYSGGMCLGDTGAPMVIDNVVVGLTSYYLGCEGNFNPDVFTRVDRYTDWILEVASIENSDLSSENHITAPKIL